MILCPNCLHREMVGAYFCSECGAQLVYSTGIPTSSIRTTGALKASQPLTKVAPPPVAPPPVASSAQISLNIIVTGDIIPIVHQQDEITLGRVSEGQPIVPDIDLTPYKAYEAGVSRMHASLRILHEMITVTDLGSANGTRINGMKISSHIPHPIKHGDILTLGKFKIQILLRNAGNGV
jgi:hypothetical protein